jgi:hypothetical protein
MSKSSLRKTSGNRQGVAMVHRMRSVSLLAGAASMLVVGLGMSACTATVSSGASSHTATAAVHSVSPSPAASSGTPYANEFQYLPPAGNVMGTGTLQDVSGHATGNVTVSVTTDLRFQVTISGFSTTADPGLAVALSVDRFGAQAGQPTVPAVDNPVGFTQGTIGDQVLPFDSSGRRDRGNLSYFNSVELVSDGTVLAAAPMAWSIPDFYPGLTVKDSGPRAYARGTVTSYNGQPASYTVWGNDNSQAVAVRFGITQDELFYLNPQLRRGDTELLRDTRLNLSVAYR